MTMLPVFRLDGLPRLGFGTASLLNGQFGDTDRLLETAYDCGLRYFDTARMYGDGRAEFAMAAFVRRHPDVVVATKVGILPPPMNLAARLARKVARRAGRQPPSFADAVFGVFDPVRVRVSVEASLRALGVDHVPVLLLHEILPEHATPELRETLSQLRTEGKIGHIGIATEPEPSVAIAGTARDIATIVQLPSSAWSRNAERVPDAPNRQVFVHSVLGSRFHSLQQGLRSDDGMAQRWSDELDLDARDPEALGALFIAEALDSVPAGLVLFSSGNRGRIAANVAAAAKPQSPGRIAALRRLVAQEAAHA